MVFSPSVYNTYGGNSFTAISDAILTYEMKQETKFQMSEIKILDSQNKKLMKENVSYKIINLNILGGIENTSKQIR